MKTHTRTLTHKHTNLHAVVADAAVRAARRPVEVAGGAPLHPDLDAFDLHVLVERRAEVVVLVLVLVGWRREETAEKLKSEEKKNHNRNAAAGG